MSLDAAAAQAYLCSKGEYMAKIANTFTISPSLFTILGQSEPQPRITPLARIAAEAPLADTGCLTEYRPLRSRSIVSKVVSKRGTPFSHAINPYRGCEFGCRYCYARYTHEFLEMRDSEQFERQIYYKENAAWLLRQDLRRLKPGTVIGIGTATDPYQPLERRQRITRSLLEVFAQVGGFRLGLITKSALILRDLELLQAVARRNQLGIHITITTMDTRLARILEPRAPRPDLRMHAVAQLRKAGLRTGVMCCPLMPGITDSRASISAVARAAAEAGANFLHANALFLKPCSLPVFFQFVRENFPALEKSYQQRYGQNAFVSPEYRKRVAELVESIRREFKLGERTQFGEAFARQPIAPVSPQPWLPFDSAPPEPIPPQPARLLQSQINRA
jgi:DNA repair photolyase